ncbi:hypothetical protein BGX23_009684 [Mortierella sp. AD031]|nr:hypothetical protein BGX23_009684 [Mortierella sp. AD031]
MELPHTTPPTTTVILAPSSKTKQPHVALSITEILLVISSFLPLFDRRFETRRHRFIDVWNPKPLLRAAQVNKAWYQVMASVLWRTYDYAIMANKVPMDVLKRNMDLVRHLSLMDKTHKKHAVLWDALLQHGHIDRLEVHEAVFPIKRLLGAQVHTLAELKISGTGGRMHPFLLGFVERLEHLRVLELTRFTFTPTDWHRIMKKKTGLRKLAILQQCVFEGFKDAEGGAAEEDQGTETSQDNGTAGTQEQSMAMDIDQAPVTDGPQARSSTNNTSNSNSNNHNATAITNTTATTNAIATNNNRKRKRRVELMDTVVKGAKAIKDLPITHLVLADNRLLFPFQRFILKSCRHLEQLEICYSQKADGGILATVVRESCPKIRRLTLRSTRQPWTLAMIDGMPQSVGELILHTGQLDLQMAAAIKERKEKLTRLDLDFGQGTKGKRRLACIMSILQESTELREFSYHNHAEDKIFKEIMFKKPWNLPNLVKLNIHGVSPRVKWDDVPHAAVPEDWRQAYGGKKDRCCSARPFEDVRKLGPENSPLFDIALLDHVKDLPKLKQVVVTEAVYHRKRPRRA